VRILALESSAKAASVAVVQDGELLGQYFQNSGLTHSVTLLAMTADLLANLKLKAGDMDLFAAASGPGSFTGIRIGVAAAKGLGWGAGKPVCGVSTTEAMAWLHAPGSGEAVICPVMDARRGQVYNALFTLRGGEPVRLCEDRAAPIAELVREAEGDARSYVLMGDGAEMSLRYFAGAGARAELAPGPIRLQCAYGVALAAMRSDAQDPGSLRPNYIRPPQAELGRR
jgi:tRNA threonylcarbamoyladenosine biosynthesis protein TsaB